MTRDELLARETCDLASPDSVAQSLTLLTYKATTDQRPPCGETWYWWRNPDDPRDWRLRIWHCKRHDCPECARKKGVRNGWRVLDFIGDRPVHSLTLTVARTGAPLQALIHHLFESFRTLNRRPTWKRQIMGGVWFFDCSYSEGAERWGPHLNLIVEADPLPLPYIKSSWLEITGDSWEVDGDAVVPGSEQSAVFYASKFAYKTFADNEGALVEYHSVLKGRRKSQPFGKWYGKLVLNPRCRRPCRSPRAAIPVPVSSRAVANRRRGIDRDT